MKKLILLLCFLLASSLSYAENWTYYGIDTDGNNYYINSDSIRVNESHGGHSVTNITVELKIDNRNEPDNYKVIKVVFYETGWVEFKSRYVYHRGTGRVLEKEEYIEGPQEKIEPDTIDAEISKSLFAQYKEGQKKEKEEMQQKNQFPYKEYKSSSIGKMGAAVFLAIIGFIVYLVKQKRSGKKSS